VPHKRHFQYERLVHQDLEPAFVAIPCSSQSEIGKPARFFVHQRRNTELLCKPRQLAPRRRPLLQIHKVRFHATLGKKPQGFSCFRAFLRPENLNVHARNVGIMDRRGWSAPRSSALFLLVSRSSELTYTPAWWVPGAHLQTMWGKLFRKAPTVTTRAERWPTPDDDEIEVHRLDAPAGSDAHTPRLVLLHGLEGTIRSNYIHGTLAQARARGWAADVLIFRGCGTEMNRQRRMYHSGETSDLNLVVQRLVDDHPDQPLVLAGFSLGGNVLLKWLGEQGDKLPAQVRAAAAVSVPFDLELGARRIERGFARVYTRHFLRTLKVKARTKLARFPELFDAGLLEGARTLYDFDDAVTAPVHGFRDAHDYYSRSSSLQYLSDVRLPTLLLSATDDPFLPPEVVDSVAIMAQDNALIQAEIWREGGHVGFVSGRSPFHPHYYAEERVVEFLANVIADGL
jgi:predicted alpha/beta-fold hydrolase